MPSGFAYSREFFQRYYTPDNATVIVTGDFDKKETLAHLQKAYGGLEGQARRGQDSASSRAQKEARDARTSSGRRRRCRACGSRGTRRRRPTCTATAVQSVLNDYLFGPTSPLYQDLVLKRQIVDSIDSTWRPRATRRCSACSLRVKKASDLETVEKARHRRDRASSPAATSIRSASTRCART